MKMVKDAHLSRQVIWTFLCFLMVDSLYAQALSMPAEFKKQVIVENMNLVGICMAPDQRIFITEKTGKIHIIKNDQKLAKPFADFTSRVRPDQEGGLLGCVTDPDFAINHYLYAYYSAKKTGNPVYVARFDAEKDTMGASSNLEWLQVGSGGPYHYGGGLSFGPDGKLYIGRGNHFNETWSQTRNIYGAILRFNKDGTIPDDNPFYNIVTGIDRSVYTWGHRNPYQIIWDLTTGKGFIYDIMDRRSDDELNEAVKGENFGFFNATTPTASGYRQPIYKWGDYKGSSMMGGLFYRPKRMQFPESYRGKFFIGNHLSGQVRLLDPQDNYKVTQFAQFEYVAAGNAKNECPIDMSLDSAGSLYLITLCDDKLDHTFYEYGKVLKITYGNPVSIEKIKQQLLGNIPQIVLGKNSRLIKAPINKQNLKMYGTDGQLLGIFKVEDGKVNIGKLAVTHGSQLFVLNWE